MVGVFIVSESIHCNLNLSLLVFAVQLHVICFFPPSVSLAFCFDILRR